MKFAVIINDSPTANLVEAFSAAESIEKTMQYCIIHNIMVNKVITYLLIES